MSDEMQSKTTSHGARKVHLSPELTEVLNMLKALERTTSSSTAAPNKPA